MTLVPFIQDLESHLCNRVNHVMVQVPIMQGTEFKLYKGLNYSKGLVKNNDRS